MHRLAQVLLLVIHALYGIKNFIFSFAPSRSPKPLLAQRQRIPAHLAIILIPDAENHDTREEASVMEECVEQAVEWSKEVGIQRLSVYDREGVLRRKSIYASSAPSEGSLGLSNITPIKPTQDPPTPPSSDTDSRPWSPALDHQASHSTIATIQLPYVSRDDVTKNEHKKLSQRRRHSQIFEPKARLSTLTLHLLCRLSSKPALAEVARSLALSQESSPQKSSGPFNLTIETLNDLLEGESGFPPPDLIIVHSLYPSTAPLELHGFPPWQTRLSEIYYAPRRGGVLRHILRFLTSTLQRRNMSTALAISETDFRRALDEYSGARMRFGK